MPLVSRKGPNVFTSCIEKSSIGAAEFAIGLTEKRRTSLPGDHIFVSNETTLRLLWLCNNKKPSGSYCIPEFVPLHLAKLNPNRRWHPSSNNPRTSSRGVFRFFFPDRDRKAIIRATAKQKIESSAKAARREFRLLVLTAHNYVRRVSSGPRRRRDALLFLTVMDFAVRCCWPLLSPVLEFRFVKCRDKNEKSRCDRASDRQRIILLRESQIVKGDWSPNGHPMVCV